MKTLYASLFLATAIVFGSAASATGAVDIFLELEGIEGEASDASHRNWIAVESFSVGLHRPDASWDSQRAGEPAVFLELTAGKALDKATPALMLAGASGNHIPSARLVVRKAGSEFSYFEIRLQEVFITSTNVSGTVEDERPTESIAMIYGRIEWIYTETLPDGSAGGTSSAGWDIRANEEV